MPKRAQEYVDEDGDGFVADAPQSKKRKAGGKAPPSTETHQDEEGNEYWEISGKRRVQVSSFKGNTFIGIREFYEKDGKVLPGKKGISLSIDQYNTLLGILPQIEGVLKTKDIDVIRPDYEGTVKGGAAHEHDADDGGPSAAITDSNADKKPNHEATSDEDEE
ncbi:hypothetical protein B0A50_02650 [Salinomyces thailandicus]|uniref:Transcriptional coactivator p15 (PC4) C-terminal domain-containing protein n=1 Tax=Salinomyces thailandicus TaxID=706561 RepID=A0A4U0U5K3_9PEZI|nr:hypothetical protein B0A50_02650 [Salinomyces thailandica]